jgi:integrase
MKLTKRFIDSAKYDGSSQDIRWDDQLPGFGVRLYSTGRKSFVLSYRAQGRKHIMTIGAYGPLTLDQARKKARKHLAEVIDGGDPLDSRQKAARGATMAALCNDFLKLYAKQRKKTWREDQRRIDRHILPNWGRIKIKSIKRSEITSFHTKLGETSPYEANRILALLSKMFEMAKAIDRDPNVFVRAAMWMYLFTGLRRSELLQLKWSDIDPTRNEIKLLDTKAGRPHYVPLSLEAIKLLNTIPRLDGNPFIFPGARKGKPLVNIGKPWDRIRKEANLEDVRLHDLRRTVGSWLAQSGKSLHLIGRVLGHSNASTTKIYARFAQDHVKSALEDHGKQILAISGKKSKANILNSPLQKKKGK